MKTPGKVRLLVLLLACNGLVAAQEATDVEKEIMSKLMSGEGVGAVIDRDGVCAGTVGGPWFSSPGTIALLAFPQAFGPEGCKNTFLRTNPNGSMDRHVNGVGGLFVILLQPSFQLIFSSGSNVHWTATQHEDGVRTISINGTLSNGSRVRAHSVQDPNGEDNSKESFFWIEGLGYLVGQRKGN